MQGIYQIRHKIDTGKRYIGSSIDITQRLKDHRKALERGNHFNLHLQAAWDKHGSDNFIFEVLETVLCACNLLGREQSYLDDGFASGRLYNLTRNADGSGPKSDEVRQRMSVAQKAYYATHESPHKGKKTGPPTEQHRQAISKAKLRYYETHDVWNKGKTGVFSEAVLQRMSDLRKGRSYSESHRQSISKATSGIKNHFYGKHHTLESRQKMSVSRGEPYPAFYNEQTGEYIPEGVHLTNLCNKKGLNYNPMSTLKRGVTQRTRAGWCLAPESSCPIPPICAEQPENG